MSEGEEWADLKRREGARREGDADGKSRLVVEACERMKAGVREAGPAGA